MARLTTRRSPRLEILEARKLLSTDVTGEQQLMLELINEALVDPDSAAERVELGLTRGAINAISRDGDTVEGVIAEIAGAESRPPVAWDSSLAEAAKRHTEYQIRIGTQTHDGPRGLETATDRVIAAGYGKPDAVAENIIYGVDSSEHAMRAFLADYGPGNDTNPHRENIQQTDSSKESLKDVGVAVLPVEVAIEQSTPFGSPSTPKTETKLVVTQVFARKDEAAPKVVGVVYNDSNNDNFYDVGEGIPNASVTITNSQTGESTTVQTWSSGGYQAEVSPGLHQVEVRVNDRLIGRRETRVGRDNTKLDFRTNDASKPSQTPTTPSTSRTATARSNSPKPTSSPSPSPSPSPARAQTPVSSPSPARARTPETSASVAPPTLPTSAIDPSSATDRATALENRSLLAASRSSAPEPRDGSSAMTLLRSSSLNGTVRSWKIAAEGGLAELELSSTSSR